MFRLHDNVPEVYVDESRDFQMFTRVYDTAFGGVKYSIDSLQKASDSYRCDSSLLNLLKTKVGLFTTANMSDDQLRCVLSVFPTIIRCKGSRKSIKYILNLYSRLMNSSSDFATYDETALNEDHKLVVTFTQPPRNYQMLKELLKYVLPTGYSVDYRVSKIRNSKTIITTKDHLEYVVSPKNLSTSSVHASDDFGFIKSDNKNELSNTINLTNLCVKASEDTKENNE